MNPEPLKDKEWNLNNIRCVKKRDLPDYTKGFHTEDIKSAVEWLKEELDKNYNEQVIDVAIELIDKAFEDVVKK